MTELHNPRIAALASGSGSTFEALVHATQDGRLKADIGLLVCNNPRAGVFERVARLNKQYGLDIKTLVINSLTHPKGGTDRGQTREESEAIARAMTDREIDHVALVGYMKVVRGDLVEEFGWRPSLGSPYEARMSNTHPGPLPETADTYGLGASQRVLELGLAMSAHTVHLVSDGVDQGPKTAVHPVEIVPDDNAQTLFDRVQVTEKTGLPYAIDKFLREQALYEESLKP